MAADKEIGLKLIGVRNLILKHSSGKRCPVWISNGAVQELLWVRMSITFMFLVDSNPFSNVTIYVLANRVNGSTYRFNGLRNSMERTVFQCSRCGIWTCMNNTLKEDFAKTLLPQDFLIIFKLHQNRSNYHIFTVKTYLFLEDRKTKKS